MNESDKYPRRKNTLRLKGYDYSQEGAYFITICADNRELIFEDKRFKEIVERCWMDTTRIRPNIELDEFVVMPNHIHGIIIIKYKRQRPVGAYCNTPPGKPGRANINSPLRGKHLDKFKSPSQTIGSIIRGFKSSSTKKINILRETPGMPVWQRNYHDHVIRDEKDLYSKRKYIRENPLKWELDEENPDNFKNNCRGANGYVPGHRRAG